jgi:hypothetical protein
MPASDGVLARLNQPYGTPPLSSTQRPLSRGTEEIPEQ